MATPTRTTLGLLALMVFALAAAGCGGGTTTNVVTRTVTETAPTTTPAEATTGAATTTEATESTTTQSHAPSTAPASAGASEPPTRFVRLPSFLSPSGNIGCMLIGGIARCDIVKRDWSPPPRPKACPHIVDYGQGLEVGRSGPAEVVCAGDTARDTTAASLPYGTASQVGPFICVSRPTGLTCTNRMSGHGFFISIQSYRRF